MVDEKTPDPTDDAAMEDLSGQVRALIGALSLAALSAGAVAVFMTDNGIGSAALLAVGLILGLIVVAGRLPSRFRYQDFEIKMARRISYAQAASEGAEIVVEAVKEVAAATPEAQPAVKAADDAARDVAAWLSGFRPDQPELDLWQDAALLDRARRAAILRRARRVSKPPEDDTTPDH